MLYLYCIWVETKRDKRENVCCFLSNCDELKCIEEYICDQMCKIPEQFQRGPFGLNLSLPEAATEHLCIVVLTDMQTHSTSHYLLSSA